VSAFSDTHHERFGVERGILDVGVRLRPARRRRALESGRGGRAAPRAHPGLSSVCFLVAQVSPLRTEDQAFSRPRTVPRFPHALAAVGVVVGRVRSWFGVRGRASASPEALQLGRRGTRSPALIRAICVRRRALRPTAGFVSLSSRPLDAPADRFSWGRSARASVRARRGRSVRGVAHEHGDWPRQLEHHRGRGTARPRPAF